jgi:hypothetical protein
MPGEILKMPVSIVRIISTSGMKENIKPKEQEEALSHKVLFWKFEQHK